MASSGSISSVAELGVDAVQAQIIVQAAVVAAKDLSSLWRTGPYSKLLQRAPPAAWEGKTADAAQHTRALLAVMGEGLAAGPSSASTEQIFNSIAEHDTCSLLARLAVWLQQQPEVTTEQAAGGSSSSSGSSGNSHATMLWSGCMSILAKVTSCLIDYLDRQPSSATTHLEHMMSALDNAGLFDSWQACLRHPGAATAGKQKKKQQQQQHQRQRQQHQQLSPEFMYTVSSLWLLLWDSWLRVVPLERRYVAPVVLRAALQSLNFVTYCMEQAPGHPSSSSSSSSSTAMEQAPGHPSSSSSSSSSFASSSGGSGSKSEHSNFPSAAVQLQLAVLRTLDALNQSRINSVAVQSLVTYQTEFN